MRLLGAVNFLFGLPAIRTIDTLGRRKWLILTLPLMCLAMLGAALSAALIGKRDVRIGIMAFFLYCKKLQTPLPYSDTHERGAFHDAEILTWVYSILCRVFSGAR